MIITATDAFVEFLDGINKESTGSVSPREFNRLFNTCQLEVVKNKYSEFERTQKRTDDLRILECVDLLPNVGVNQPGGELFNLPYDQNNFVQTPGNPGNDNHGYMFLLNCSFQLQYINDDCDEKGLSEFLKAKPMKADKEFEIYNDPYNKPTNKRIYYKLIGNTLRAITKTDSFAVQARIDYLRYPREINVPHPDANQEINPELPLHMIEEIIDVCIRKKLGIYESPRYQQKIAEDSQSIT